MDYVWNVLIHKKLSNCWDAQPFSQRWYNICYPDQEIHFESVKHLTLSSPGPVYCHSASVYCRCGKYIEIISNHYALSYSTFSEDHSMFANACQRLMLLVSLTSMCKSPFVRLPDVQKLRYWATARDKIMHPIFKTTLINTSDFFKIRCDWQVDCLLPGVAHMCIFGALKVVLFLFALKCWLKKFAGLWQTATL